MDSYFYSSYNPYAGRYPRGRDAGWKYKSYLSQYGDSSDAFNNHQRAQLKSILSQINPKLTPRLRKANTKDVAVQVNPRRDASVQCSIGPRTLQAMRRDLQRRRRPEPPAPGAGSPKAAGGVRYPRTLAVYSPIAYRSVTSFLVEDGSNKEQQQEDEASGEALHTAEPAGDPEKENGPAEDGKAAKPLELDRKVEKLQVRSEGAEEAAGKARVRFQVSPSAPKGALEISECLKLWLRLNIHEQIQKSPFCPSVSGTEVRILSLQRMQPQMGKCLRVVRSGHQQGKQQTVSDQ